MDSDRNKGPTDKNLEDLIISDSKFHSIASAEINNIRHQNSSVLIEDSDTEVINQNHQNSSIPIFSNLNEKDGKLFLKRFIDNILRGFKAKYFQECTDEDLVIDSTKELGEERGLYMQNIIDKKDTTKLKFGDFDDLELFENFIKKKQNLTSIEIKYANYCSKKTPQILSSLTNLTQFVLNMSNEFHHSKMEIILDSLNSLKNLKSFTIIFCNQELVNDDTMNVLSNLISSFSELEVLIIDL
jgi:hypothetical protein